VYFSRFGILYPAKCGNSTMVRQFIFFASHSLMRDIKKFKTFLSATVAFANWCTALHRNGTEVAQTLADCQWLRNDLSYYI
jgi:hypothetical protein